MNCRRFDRYRGCKFAANLAPEPFEDYLTTNKKGRTRVKRLPAHGDPMMARVDNIRASENLFIDTLDQNFAAFFAKMEAPYASWRKYTYEEEKAYKALKRKALTQKILGGLAILGAALADPGSPVASVARDAAMIGGMAAIHSGIATSKEAKIHAEAIRELAASVETELEPIVIDVRGQTLRLSGSAETQYQEWQKLMREIWATETGLPVDPNQPGGPTIRSGPEAGSSTNPWSSGERWVTVKRRRNCSLHRECPLPAILIPASASKTPGPRGLVIDSRGWRFLPPWPSG